VIITFLAHNELWRRPVPLPGTAAAAADGGSDYQYDDRSVCEAGYNASTALAAPSYLKDSGPFLMAVRARLDHRSLFSLYFSGCGKLFRYIGICDMALKGTL
jgi:hypothetical protein